MIIETDNYKLEDNLGVTLTYKPSNWSIFFQPGDDAAEFIERYRGYLSSRLCNGNEAKALEYLFSEYAN